MVRAVGDVDATHAVLCAAGPDALEPVTAVWVARTASYLACKHPAWCAPGTWVETHRQPAEEGGVEVLLEEAQTQRVVQGNGTLSRRLAASLAERGVEIRLGAEVVECSHSAKDGATVATRDGARFRARQVVLARFPARGSDVVTAECKKMLVARCC